METPQRKALSLLIAPIAVIVIWLQYRQSLSFATGQSFVWVGMATEDAGSYSSPPGTTKVYVTFHDPAAVHSGNFWTWITTKDLLHGRRVVAEAYSSFPVRYGRERLPIEWVDEKSFWISFVNREGDNPTRKLVHVE